VSSKQFDKTLNQLGRIVAMSLVIPCAFAGLVGNPASFAAAVVFLRIATQPAGSVGTVALPLRPLARRRDWLRGKPGKEAKRGR
jgi:hypothetical protein